MRDATMTNKNAISKTRLLLAPLALTLLITGTAHAAVPGISTGLDPSMPSTFSLTAQDSYLNQPDGQAVYSWGYGCASGFSPTFLPKAITAPVSGCPTMQVPGPTLIVTEGQTVKITLTNKLPAAAGNTSILFPGFNVCAATLSAGACTGTPSGVTGLLTQEAAPGGNVTYTFVASAPGTHAYYSGTQGDLQVEMGLYGAIIVLPANPPSADNKMLSVNTWRSSLARDAPNASRVRNSVLRADARASSSIATFAHAISSTSPTTATKTSSGLEYR